MTTQYPGKIDDNTSLPDAIDSITPVQADVVNRLKQAILAIESELGTKPSGVYSSLKARLSGIDSSINSFEIIKLAKDLGGSLDLPQVIGIRGTPVANAIPIADQVLSFNGLTWIPKTLSSGSSITFSGDLSGSSTSQTVIKLQGYAVATTTPTEGYVLTWEASSSSWKPKVASGGSSFTAGGDLSGSSTSQTVIKLQSYAVASTAPTEGYVLTWDSSSSSWKPVAVKLQGYAVATTVPTNNYVLTWESSSSSWKPKIVPAILYTELYLTSGLEVTTSNSYIRAGARKIDLSYFPSTIGSLTRVVKFVANVDKTATATNVAIQLYDNTNGVLVTSTNLTSTSVSNVEVSATITAGASSGNLRTDSAAQYELQLKMTGGSAGDSVACTSAYILITYA
tara:strand:- start:7137 stop:8324 length:1188 start_codon:yes stop_codon:yes gene_type:complete